MRKRCVIGLCGISLFSSIASGQDYFVGSPGVIQASPSDAIVTEATSGFPAAYVWVEDASAAEFAEVARASEKGTVAGEKTLSEGEVRQIVEKYLKDQEGAAEAKLTPKEKNEKALAMNAMWNDGLELSTKDKAFRLHVGGRYQFDTSWFATPQNVNNNINVPYTDGVDFRRARIRLDGTLYEVHEYALEFDFVNSVRVRNQPGTTNFFDETVTAPTDLWWQIKQMPIVGNVRFGYHKEQVGFEHIVSSRFQPFMERSYNQDTFYGGLFKRIPTRREYF